MYKGENHFDVKGKCESLLVLNEEVPYERSIVIQRATDINKRDK